MTVTPSGPVEGYAALPDPGPARTLDDLVERLRTLKIWAGDPSYDAITERVNAAWRDPLRPAAERAKKNTVADCFRLGRRRLNADLVAAVVEALHPDAGYVAQWRQALRVVTAEAQAALQVRVQDTLPGDLAEFTGRDAELDRLRQVLREGGSTGDAAVISAIEGMAGVGKTQLAIRAAHLFHAEEPFERVLFVNLRGFHPDPGQPPAEPAAVLESFLRLLGVPGHQIPHELEGRAAAYRARLRGVRALVVLDNAADERQVEPLLPGSPGCLTLVTSRRSLAKLHATTHLAVDVFTPDEAVAFLRRAAPGVPAGEDPDALARIARHCGHLPLALGLVGGQMRARPGWTATDHAELLDERHRERRIATGVELALALSYRGLRPDRQRFFRLLALHPGQDVDVFAAGALTGVPPEVAREHLAELADEYLLRPGAPGRYVLHDLVRAYAADRARDEDPPAARRSALGDLLDHYLYAAATAMDALVPAERERRPRVAPPDAPVPALADPADARGWLDAERANLTTAAGYAVANGWPTHTVRLAATLHRYLQSGGHYGDALTLHAHARRAARESGDRAAEAHTLTSLGGVLTQIGRHAEAADHHRQALALSREAGDRLGEARALGNLGLLTWKLGRHEEAIDHNERAVVAYREIGDRVGEAAALGNLGLVLQRLGRYAEAATHQRHALAVSREIGDRLGEAIVLGNLGVVYQRQGRYDQAAEHQRKALSVCREIGDRLGEADALVNLGLVLQGAGRYAEAIEHQRRALELAREISARDTEAHALTDLGLSYQSQGRGTEATELHLRAIALFQELREPSGEAEALIRLGASLLADGQPGEAGARLAAALALATGIGDRYQQAHAHRGLADVRRATGDSDGAREHADRARALAAELGLPED